MMSSNDQPAAQPHPHPAPIPRSRLRPILVVAVAVIVVLEIVALSPSLLDENPPSVPISPEALFAKEEQTLASGVPKDRIPEYSVEKFSYVSTQGGIKQWKLVAERAYLYNGEKLTHGRIIRAELYDAGDKVTLVTGKEAKYYLNERDLEVYGDVVTVFPDGFETHSEYLRYRPQLKRTDIPQSYHVIGQGKEEDGQDLAFTSSGLHYDMKNAMITLPKDAHVVMTRRGPKEGDNAGVPDETVIDSDHCVIDREERLAHFTMYPSRPLASRFVRITQPDLFARSRTADLHYGDFSDLLQYLIAYEDVLVKEKNAEGTLRYGTGGRADFDTRRDVIVLREYPQVYQDHDTITGDVIVVHRDTDVVEVEHSNAFSEGEQKQPQPKPSPSPNPSGKRAR